MVDRFGRKRFSYAAVAVFAAGLILLFFVREVPLVALGGTIMMCGFLLLNIVINTSIRDNTPKDKVGLFQGIRMIFFVLIPMTVGPAIGNAVIWNSNITFVNEFKEITRIPTPEVFLMAGLISVLLIIPMIFVQKNAEAEKVNKNG